MPDISIVICTLSRPQQLEGALASCLALSGLGGHDVEVVVVDNSLGGDSKPIGDRHAGSLAPQIRYVHEPRTGISHARNAGIAASRAPLIAFLDDDMRLSPQWLSCVMKRMADGKTDALICAIEPLVENLQHIPDARLLAYYRRDLNLPEAAPVRIKRTGHIPGAGAGNSVLRRATCISDANLFDPAFSGGGEDTEFFLRLGRRVFNIRWSAECLAYEVVSPARAGVEFVSYGVVRGSRNLARALIKNSRHPLATKARLLAIGCAQGSLRLVHYGFLRLSRSADAPLARLAALSALGKLPWRLDEGSWWAMPR